MKKNKLFKTTMIAMSVVLLSTSLLACGKKSTSENVSSNDTKVESTTKSTDTSTKDNQTTVANKENSSTLEESSSDTNNDEIVANNTDTNSSDNNDTSSNDVGSSNDTSSNDNTSSNEGSNDTSSNTDAPYVEPATEPEIATIIHSGDGSGDLVIPVVKPEKDSSHIPSLYMGDAYALNTDANAGGACSYPLLTPTTRDLIAGDCIWKNVTGYYYSNTSEFDCWVIMRQILSAQGVDSNNYSAWGNLSIEVGNYNEGKIRFAYIYAR